MSNINNLPTPNPSTMISYTSPTRKKDGTVYTNNTGLPLYVLVQAYIANPLSVGNLGLSVNSSSQWRTSYYPATGTVYTTVYGVVLPGLTYTVSDSTGAQTQNVWTEWN